MATKAGKDAGLSVYPGGIFGTDLRGAERGHVADRCSVPGSRVGLSLATTPPHRPASLFDARRFLRREIALTIGAQNIIADLIHRSAAKRLGQS